MRCALLVCGSLASSVSLIVPLAPDELSQLVRFFCSLTGRGRPRFGDLLLFLSVSYSSAILSLPRQTIDFLRYPVDMLLSLAVRDGVSRPRHTFRCFRFFCCVNNVPLFLSLPRPTFDFFRFAADTVVCIQVASGLGEDERKG